MWKDPAEEWRRLTEHYRSLSDQELLELAADRADLTEVAQQVLRDELKTRGLSMPGLAAPAQAPKEAATVIDHREDFALHVSSAIGADEDQTPEGPVDYTWKTQLCECETQEQMWQLAAALRRAGVDSWMQSRGLAYPRLMVAADQLDQARMIATQPIPQDIVDQLKADENEPPAYFASPRCPTCGADDPTLEDVDPTNQWKCEVCGRQWTETASASPAESNG